MASRTNQESFKTSSLQIGNLKRCLSEASDGSLVFRDVYYPQGIKLKDLKGNLFITIYSEIAQISGYLQSQIDDLNEEIDGIIVSVEGVSGYLQDQITNNYIQMVNISGDLHDQISTTYYNLTTISGSLQDQIINNYYELVAVSGSLQEQITLLDLNSFSSLQSISAYLQEQITNNRTEVIVISGDLQNQITNNRTEVILISGDLQNQIDNMLYGGGIESISGYLDAKKMDKVIPGTEGDFIILDIHGNASDSGIHFSDMIISQTVSITASGEEGWRVIDQVLCSDAPNILEWQIYAYNVDNNALKYASRIMAIYSCDTQEMDWTEYSVLNLNNQVNVPIQLVFNGSYIELQVQGTSTLLLKAKKITTARELYNYSSSSDSSSMSSSEESSESSSKSSSESSSSSSRSSSSSSKSSSSTSSDSSSSSDSSDSSNSSSSSSKSSFSSSESSNSSSSSSESSLSSSSETELIANCKIEFPVTENLVSPLIYGMAAAGSTEISGMQLPLNRWGGTTACRYNWELNVWNVGYDWFFENQQPDINWSQFLTDCQNNKSTTAILTLPVVGYIAKDSTSYSYSIAKYGPQQYSDYWKPDAGNGVSSINGLPITTNDPTDANIVCTSGFLVEWFDAIKENFSELIAENRLIFALGNEPMLWNINHRDVHPDPVGYDELLQKQVDMAVLVRSNFGDSVQIMGPDLWGWSAYFQSALDRESGNTNDRLAHGNMDLLPWFLQNIKTQETNLGMNLIDILAIHFYPQADGVYSDRTDGTVPVTRLESVRSLYDLSYTDPSWINSTVKLIPRMKDWISTYHSRLKLGLTEYNWGAENDSSGALALAECFGIFAREGLDMANLWLHLTTGSMSYKAYKLFRGIDEGLASATKYNLDTVWQDGSDNSRKRTVYCYHHPVENKIVLMIVNKLLTEETITIDLSDLEVSNPVAKSLVQDSEDLLTPSQMRLSYSNKLNISLYPRSLTRVDLDTAISSASSNSSDSSDSSESSSVSSSSSSMSSSESSSSISSSSSSISSSSSSMSSSESSSSDSSSSGISSDSSLSSSSSSESSDSSDSSSSSSATIIPTYFTMEYTDVSSVSVSYEFAEDLIVNWGDESENTYNGNGTASHNYSSPGTYNVTMHGHLHKFNLETGKDKLTRILEGFDTTTGNSLLYFYYTFNGCTSLTSIVSTLFEHCSNVTEMRFAFKGCSALSSIPSGLFDNCTSITNFEEVFHSCTSLTTIPSGLFSNNTNATNFHASFNSSGITGIPSTIFPISASSVDFGWTFGSCSALTSIGSTSFDGISSVSDFAGIFFNDTNLDGNAPAIWSMFPSASHTWAFYGCNGLDNYGDIPGDWK